MKEFSVLNIPCTVPDYMEKTLRKVMRKSQGYSILKEDMDNILEKELKENYVDKEIDYFYKSLLDDFYILTWGEKDFKKDEDGNLLLEKGWFNYFLKKCDFYDEQEKKEKKKIREQRILLVFLAFIAAIPSIISIFKSANNTNYRQNDKIERSVDKIEQKIDNINLHDLMIKDFLEENNK